MGYEIFEGELGERFHSAVGLACRRACRDEDDRAGAVSSDSRKQPKVVAPTDRELVRERTSRITFG